ncbi:MAG: hypothetical protein S4CHLAM20_01330 [Chlamydiia bacterium]|nr:hypothetical protein [Chlamydiia bacterium]
MKKFLFLGIMFISLFSHTEYLKKNIYSLSEINKIPKIIHQVWVGKKPIPKKYVRYMQTWRDKHPEWEYKLWTDDDVEGFDWTNKDYFLAVTNPGMKSDIWRYEIVCKYGGVYVDCDMECIKPLDLINDRLEFYTGFNGTDSKTLGNHFFAAIPNSVHLKRLLHFLKQDFRRLNLNTMDLNDVQKATGPYFFSKILKDEFLYNGNPREVAMPSIYFQPIECLYGGQAQSNKDRNNIMNKCFAIHHNGASWVAGES